jgi:hypothetical protein
VAEIDVLEDEHWTAHEVVLPGAYRQVCVELKVQNLAVCALENAVLLSELEGSEFSAAAGTCAAALPSALNYPGREWTCRQKLKKK